MRSRLGSVLLTLLVLALHPSLASDHLEPEDSLFSGVLFEDYTKMVLEALGEAYDERVVVRMVAFPSFHPEFAVAIRESSGTYTVLRLAPEKQLWAYKTKDLMKSGQIQKVTESGHHVKPNDEIAKIEKDYPANFRDVRIMKCSAPIDAPIANDIRRVWELMLLNTRYSTDAHLGMDGTDYHFSMPGAMGRESCAGKTWSPPKDSPPRQLVDIATSLADFCLKESDRATIAVRLKDQVSRLLTTLEPTKR
jgi:hypothetical protein